VRRRALGEAGRRCDEVAEGAATRGTLPVAAGG
jgi:hypothetical protein